MDSHVFKNYHINNGMDEIEFVEKRTRKNDDFFLQLEQLILQRNSVAHSWNVEDRITLRDIKNLTIPFIKLLCDCILRICVANAYLLKSNDSMFHNERPIAVFNKDIVCFNNQNVKIATGDYIVYFSNEDSKVAKIENIQFNNVDIKLVQETESKDIGVKIDNTMKMDDKIQMIINCN